MPNRHRVDASIREKEVDTDAAPLVPRHPLQRQSQSGQLKRGNYEDGAGGEEDHGCKCACTFSEG